MLYGVGYIFGIFLKSKVRNLYSIVDVCDSDDNKWGTNRDSYVIQKPESIDFRNIDKVIITASSRADIADYVLKCGARLEQIYYYDVLRDTVISYRNEYLGVINEHLYRKMAADQLGNGLLLEALYNNEFEEFNRVVVMGSEKDYSFVKRFFETVGNGMIVSNKENQDDIKATDKFILTDEMYRERIRELRSMKVGDNQWIIIPLFDVEETIR